jgi:hypothetical protein
MAKLKPKHNKLRNTGVLFELLARQMTADLLNNRQPHSLSIIKKHFRHGTELNKELGYYQCLMNESFNQRDLANKFIDNIVSARKKINDQLLQEQKYNLIKDIKKHYDLKEFVSAKIHQYKPLAAIYNMFEIDETEEPIESVKNRSTLVEHIANGHRQPVVEELAESMEDKDIRLLSYKLLVERFNDKYKTFNDGQKKLLREYITNVSNTNSLKKFIQLEINGIEIKLNSKIEKIKEPRVQIKLKEAVNFLNDLRKTNQYDDYHISALLKYHQLITELETV